MRSAELVRVDDRMLGEIGGISCRRGSPAPSAAIARDGLCCGPLFDTVSTTRSNLLRIRDKLDIILRPTT